MCVCVFVQMQKIIVLISKTNSTPGNQSSKRDHLFSKVNLVVCPMAFSGQLKIFAKLLFAQLVAVAAAREAVTVLCAPCSSQPVPEPVQEESVSCRPSFTTCLAFL